MIKDIKPTALGLSADEGGATFLEYTFLLGIILSVSLAVLAAVGGWAGETWGYLCTVLDSVATAISSCTP